MRVWSLTPLSLRVPLAVAVLMLLMGMVAAQLVMSALTRNQERQLRELARVEFESLEMALGPMVVRDDIWGIFDILERTTQREGALRVERATLVDTRGRVVVSSAPDLLPIGSSAATLIDEAIPFSRIHYDQATEVIPLRANLSFQGRTIGQTIISFDVRELLRERRTAWQLLLWGNGAATLILAFAGYWVVRHLLAPISHLARQMDAPSGAPQPIAASMVPKGDTELSKLYHTYNSMIRAVQARGEAERRLAERERFVSLGRLAGTLAHEINNPLGGMLNAVDTIRRYPARAEVVLSSANLLDRGLRHLRDIVRVTLDTHRADKIGETLKAEDFDDLQALIKPEISRQMQQLDWRIDLPDTGLDSLPSSPVRQILLNLLLNATSSAGKGAGVGLRVCVEDNGLLLVVWDTGPGLAAHLHPRLLSDAPLGPGGGVGLRLVRELVLKLHGMLALSTSAEGHQEIRILLPLMQTDFKETS